MATIHLLATLTPQPGQADALRAALREMAPPSRQERGCLRYDVLEDGEGEAVRFHVVERFVDNAAVQAHGESEHYGRFSARFGELLAGPPQVIRARDVDVA
ncbi:putative quinol monooxygenase [Deinococcus sp. S9]|uniref:putative quinol monooxygenase n=1 Tax=Deinococcus sp. S9 TaxID=2545754 RepID=UPI001054DD9E|nr:putative quinol monooxygenase [Deinococcus sp. S9]TDE84752.1 antibiotic biosynthesis monooxygenase [Deinococcus sp. S9]